MARLRTIKPEFWTSEQIMELTPLARLAFVGMWNFADDRGVHPSSCKTLKAEVFPGDDGITVTDVSDLVNEMLQQGLVAEFEANEKCYWHVTGWARHQKIDKPTYRHPAPSISTPQPRELDAASPNATRELDAASGVETKRDETRLKKPSRPESRKPAFETDDLRFAEFFFAELRKINPEHKKPNLESWAKETRLMRERDGRALRDAAELVSWCIADPFWKTNILSVAKLREKWDALTIKKNSANPKDPNWQKRPEFAGML